MNDFKLPHLFQPDLILWTGDINSHDVWNYTKSDTLSLMKKLTGLFTKYFAGIPVYAAVGNHEEVPSNKFVLHVRIHSLPLLQFPTRLSAGAVQSRLAVRRASRPVERVDVQAAVGTR